MAHRNSRPVLFLPALHSHNIIREVNKLNQHKPDLEKISKMHPLEKQLIALRGAFQYAEKHGIHVDNRHSIENITKALNDYRRG